MLCTNKAYVLNEFRYSFKLQQGVASCTTVVHIIEGAGLTFAHCLTPCSDHVKRSPDFHSSFLVPSFSLFLPCLKLYSCLTCFWRVRIFVLASCRVCYSTPHLCQPGRGEWHGHWTDHSKEHVCSDVIIMRKISTKMSPLISLRACIANSILWTRQQVSCDEG